MSSDFFYWVVYPNVCLAELGVICGRQFAYLSSVNSDLFPWRRGYSPKRWSCGIGRLSSARYSDFFIAKEASHQPLTWNQLKLKFFQPIARYKNNKISFFFTNGIVHPSVGLMGLDFLSQRVNSGLKIVLWKKQHKHEPLTESQPKLTLFQPTARYRSNSISVVFVDGAVHPSVVLMGLDVLSQRVNSAFKKNIMKEAA